MRYSNDEPDLQKIRGALDLSRRNLQNQGLMAVGAELVYWAAIQTGASPEEAWELTRQYELVFFAPIAPRSFTTAELLGGFDRRHRQAMASRQETIARIKALPNPFGADQQVAA